MAKFTDAVVVTLKGYFDAGDQFTEAHLDALIAAIQEGIEEHDHAGTGDGDGIMDIGPISNLAIRMSGARSELNIECYDAGAHHSRLYLKKSDTNTLGTLAQTDDGDQLMQIAGMGVGSNLTWAYGAFITAYQRGAAGAALIETDLIFTTCTTTGTNTNQLYLDGGTGFVGLGCVPNSKLEINLATENLEFVDAGSAGATEQDWIEVETGGVQGYIRVYAAK